MSAKKTYKVQELLEKNLEWSKIMRLYATDDQGLISYVHFFDDAVKEIVFSANHKSFWNSQL